MKKLYTLVSVVILSASLWAQAPQKMSYQAVIRGANNALVIDKPVGVRVSIIQGTEFGASVYIETHTPTTNANGLASLSLGTGKIITGEFSKIDWSKGPYFVKTETDVEGGTNYQLTSVSELMSVPYALYAGNSLPNNGKDGQYLNMCEGIPTWTSEGICPGIVNSIKCDSVIKYGKIYSANEVYDARFVVYYVGKKQGKIELQEFTSLGVEGLTAKTYSNYISGDKDSITFYLKGTPMKEGVATFKILIGGQTCIVPVTILSKPKSGYGETIYDIDGNSYKTVFIGNQQWMAENLKTIKYNDGTFIKFIDGAEWQNNKTGAYSFYDNNDSYIFENGLLYNWYAISPTSNGNKNVCPSGWHVPTDNEWTILTDYLGGENIAGGKMKEIGTINWNSPNTDATNTSNFTGIPSGCRNTNGNFYHIKNNAYWWSSTSSSTTNAWYRNLFNINGTANRANVSKADGFSIRCLKD